MADEHAMTVDQCRLEVDLPPWPFNDGHGEDELCTREQFEGNKDAFYQELFFEEVRNFWIGEVKHAR